MLLIVVMPSEDYCSHEVLAGIQGIPGGRGMRGDGMKTVTAFPGPPIPHRGVHIAFAGGRAFKCLVCKKRLRRDHTGWFIRRDEKGRVVDCVCPDCVRGL